MRVCATAKGMREYYARRAATYERVYFKPERQADLRAMEAWLGTPFAGREVLEVACGTGWWTPHGDNAFVAASSTPLSRRDADGNTYQQRTLDDGSMHEVLKNFPTRAEALARLGPRAHDAEWIAHAHYWVLSYRLT
jgi:hypothetical protein